MWPLYIYESLFDLTKQLLYFKRSFLFSTAIREIIIRKAESVIIGRNVIAFEVW